MLLKFIITLSSRYLGKDETANPQLCLSENVVMKLITTDNYFTSIKLAEMLKSKNTSLVGTMKKTEEKFVYL